MHGTSDRFVLQKADDVDFVDRGLRDYFCYRDAGAAESTQGRVAAQVLRARHAVSKAGQRHHHVVEFQMNYILKGWAKMWFEGEGEVLLEAGTTLYMPPGIKHSFVACSEDYETLEIVMPADFETVDEA